MTNKVVIHIRIPTPPVWLSATRQAAVMLRGYRNSSRQEVFSTSGRLVGSSISPGSIISAHASDLRASSCRPMRISQRGDSGTQYRIISTSSAGAKPTRNNPRQPIAGARNAPDSAPRMLPAGSRVVVSPLTQPRL